MDRIIMMIVRMVGMQVVRKGIGFAMNKMSRGSKPAQSERPVDPEQMKRTKESSRIIKRTTRF